MMTENTIIQFDDVWAAWRVDPVLKAINWRWQQGQQWAILGGNGAGKTTLASLITDTLRPRRGHIQRHASLDPREGEVLHLSFELQRELIEHDLRFDDSETRADAFDEGTPVKQIILRGAAEDERFHDIVRRCHIDHILNRGIRFVSTGESRKTLLARALFHQPRLLILDNPFEGLDRQSQEELHHLINQLLTSPLNILLLIKQREEIPENITHVLELDAGAICYSGAPADLPPSPQTVPEAPSNAELPPPAERLYSIDPGVPLIAMEHVNVSYREQQILTDINWTFNPGQHCCISGPNGAGKSTLLSLLCGDNHKAYGQNIQLFGQLRGSGESIWELKQKFGVVSTQMQLNHVGRTRVAEVIASGLYDSVGLHRECSGRDRNIALQWLRALDLESVATQYYNQLSFGQQRLAMLARAMVKSPLVLVLDEPCIGLDSSHRKIILETVDHIAARGDCHILYVSHTADEMPDCINQRLTLVPHASGGYTSEVS